MKLLIATIILLLSNNSYAVSCLAYELKNDEKILVEKQGKKFYIKAPERIDGFLVESLNLYVYNSVEKSQYPYSIFAPVQYQREGKSIEGNISIFFEGVKVRLTASYGKEPCGPLLIHDLNT